MILKIYNKLNNYHEVDISETISYLLEFSDHYTNKTFQYIHIIHLLHYFKTHLKKDFFHINNNILNIDSWIIIDDKEFFIISYINDYIYYKISFNVYCLYDYYNFFYKSKRFDRIQFDSRY